MAKVNCKIQEIKCKNGEKQRKEIKCKSGEKH